MPFVRDVTASLWSSQWIPLESSPQRRAYCGLALRRFLRFSPPPQASAPFGWCYVRELDRNAVLLMPRWLAWVHAVRGNWQWWVFGPLSMWGFWDMKENGGYWLEGRWTWCWWHSRDRWLESLRARTDVTPRELMTSPDFPHSWWFRLGWWIEDHTRHVRMPLRVSEL